ncbi:MAG: type IV pilus twitching motility protein PilT [Planctomycetota bacterium]
MDLERLLRTLAARNGSDLHLKVGRPPLMRLLGDLLPTDEPPVAEAELRSALYSVMGERCIRIFESSLEVDFAFEIEGLARFRVNVFTQRSRIGSVMRLVPMTVPSVESLELPPVLNAIADNPDGLVLVTGPTGCGKSTTLAAMIEHINQTAPRHIVTVEDPIEFTHADKRSTINQRELGVDTGALSTVLRTVLRQDPDVILMGEMRDPETISFGITAAETGHLVFATLHTQDTKQTVERILDTMPPNVHATIRTQLSQLLRAIVCQRLCKRADGSGRIAAVEVLINTASVSHLLQEGETRSLEHAIYDGAYYQMQTFDQALYAFVRDGVVTEEEALTQSATPEDLKLLLRGIHRGPGHAEEKAPVKKLLRRTE